MPRTRVSPRLGVLVCLLLCAAPAMHAQSFLDTSFPTPKVHRSDETGPKFNAWAEQHPSPKVPSPSLEDMDQRLDVNWHRLPKNFLQDQKDMWLLPLKAGQGKHVLPTLAVTAITGGLIASDPKTEPHFRKLDAFQDTSAGLGGKVSGGVIAGVPATFYLVSLLRHDHYDQATALFAGEAVVDDTILMIVMKAITRRERPSDRPVNGPYDDSFFKSSAGPLGKGSSFPSGHAMMSFSVATVFARRYKQHKWLPWVAYGAATMISFTRLTTGAHFPSEVFIGAALGYVIARYDVLHGH